MTDKSKKIRVVSLKEASDINKKNVAYFTLTDGSMAVVKKDGKSQSQNYISQKEEFSKYNRNFASNNYYNLSYRQESKNQYFKNDYKVSDIKNNDKENISNYKRRNDSSQEKEDCRGNAEKNSEYSTSKGYSFKGQVYGNQSSGESNKERFSYRKKYLKGQNEASPPAEGYSFKGGIYGNQSTQEKNQRESSYKRKYQSEQNESNSPDKGYSYKGQVYGSQKSQNNQEYNVEKGFSYKSQIYGSQKNQETNQDKGYSFKGQVYDSKNNQNNQEINEDKGKLRYKIKYQSEQNNTNINNYNSSSNGYSYKSHVYSNTNENSNINDDSSTHKKNQLRRYQNQNQNQNIINNNKIQEKKNMNYNNNNNDNINYTNIYQPKNLRIAKDLSQSNQYQYLSQVNKQKQNEYLSTQSYTQEIRNINDYPQIKNKNVNYKYQVIEAIPVKLVDNYNFQMRNYSYPKPQYVQPYINPEIIIVKINLGQSGCKFGNQSNIDCARGCNTNYFNQFNKQITDSFHDFDNLQEYDQREFRNDPFYRNVDLKYSELSVEPENNILKSYNKQVKNYEHSFTNVEIKNSNYRNRNGVLRKENSQINNHKLKVSNGS